MKNLALFILTLALPFSSLANECRGEVIIKEPIYGAVDADTYIELNDALSKNDTDKLNSLAKRSLITSFKQGEKTCLHETHFLNYRLVVTKKSEQTKYLIPDNDSVKIITYK